MDFSKIHGHQQEPAVTRAILHARALEIVGEVRAGSADISELEEVRGVVLDLGHQEHAWVAPIPEAMLCSPRTGSGPEVALCLSCGMRWHESVVPVLNLGETRCPRCSYQLCPPGGVSGPETPNPANINELGEPAPMWV